MKPYLESANQYRAHVNRARALLNRPYVSAVLTLPRYQRAPPKRSLSQIVSTGHEHSFKTKPMLPSAPTDQMEINRKYKLGCENAKHQLYVSSLPDSPPSLLHNGNSLGGASGTDLLLPLGPDPICHQMSPFYN